jgi:hypothetical protein
MRFLLRFLYCLGCVSGTINAVNHHGWESFVWGFGAATLLYRITRTQDARSTAGPSTPEATQ